MQTILFHCRWMFVVMIVIAAFSPARAEVDEQNTPEALATVAMIAMKEHRLADFAAMMHPDALAELKRSLLSVADAAEELDAADEILNLFKDVPSVDALRELDDAAFFVAFLEGSMQLRPVIRETLSNMTTQIIGAVAEGTDVVHVVYRGTVTYGEQKIAKLSVISFKANGETWGMLLSGDVEANVVMLKEYFKDIE